MKLRSLLFSFGLVPFVVAGCAADTTEDDAESEDQAIANVDVGALDVVEAGRFYSEGKLEGLDAAGKRVPALRFNAFGGTKIHAEVTGASAPGVLVVGPLPSEERAVVFSKYGRNGKTIIDATIDKPGAYKIIVGSRENFARRDEARERFAVSFACKAECAPKQIPLDDMVRGLKAQVGEERLAQGLDQLVDGVVTDEAMNQAFKGQLRAALGAPTLGTTPMVSMEMMAAAQGLLEQVPANGTSQNDNGRFDANLDTVGDDCRVTREAPAPVSASLPGVARGHAPDYAIDDCTLARLNGLVRALNALSMQNGSVVTMGGRTLETPGAVAAALLDSGHTIKVENVRFIADFLGLNYQGVSVMAPVWVDTGIPLPSGGTLRIPSPHAHHNLWVEGPRFRGQLKFYMGVPAGIRFKVQDTITPEWDGGPTLSGRVEYAFDGAAERDGVIKTFDDAGELRRKWTLEGQGRPLDGYGQLGVCTDSTAFIEFRRTGKATLFPLLHPVPREARDQADRDLAALTTDVDGFEPEDAIRRIALSFPTKPADSPFKAFREGMRDLGY